MYNIASVAFAAALGVAGMAKTVSAEAHPYVSVGIGLPGFVAVEPFTYASPYYGYATARYRPFYYGHDWNWRDRDDRFRHHWDRDGDRRWERR